MKSGSLKILLGLSRSFACRCRGPRSGEEKIIDYDAVLDKGIEAATENECEEKHGRLRVGVKVSMVSKKGEKGGDALS